MPRSKNLDFKITYLEDEDFMDKANIIYEAKHFTDALLLAQQNLLNLEPEVNSQYKAKQKQKNV